MPAVAARATGALGPQVGADRRDRRGSSLGDACRVNQGVPGSVVKARMGAP